MPPGLLYLISNIIHWNLHFTISLCPSQIENIFIKQFTSSIDVLRLNHLL
ncbi:hypothetical protein a20_189 [Escherichia phage a20]|nr:hypothetical protein [Escherichia phage vB_EcoM_TU01]UUB18187.1 hypothetical protein [Escherichia phage ST2]WBF82749.1 hypothetical protein a20_189 [Escherichia phage a20]